MKKVVALALCFCMIFSSVVVLGAVDESYKVVLETIKKRIPDTEEFSDFSAVQTNNDGVKIYQFSWNNEETGNSMNVECLESGIITRFNCYTNEENYEEKAFSDLSMEEALERAQDAFANLNPDIKDRVKIEHGKQNKQLWETRRNFVITRIENGLEVYGDSGNIEMDIDAENITWFYINWSDYESFENPQNSISVEDAKEIFADKLGLCLTYKAEYKDGKIVPYLVYTLKESADKYVDFEGNIINCDPYAIYRTGSGSLKNMTMSESMDLAVEFTKAEIIEMEKLDLLLTQYEVENILKNNANVNISDVELVSSSVRRDYYNKEKYYYNLSYTSDNVRVTASVDAATGEIISYSRYTDSKGEGVISKEDARKKAEQAVKELCTNNFDQYQLISSDDCSIIYHRMVNNVRFPHDNINVTINEYTGEISSYSKTYSDVEFPPIDNVVSLNMIYKCAYKLFPYDLKYIPSYNQDTKKNEIKLVFAFSSESFDIDPFTGEEYNNDDEDGALEYDDLEGHYAQKYIEELASYRVGLGINKFMPDNKIRQKELIFLLVKALHKYYSPYLISEEEIEEDYDIAIREGIIKKDEIDKEAFVTRKDASKFFVNAMGYGAVAEAESIFNCPFTDVSENKGSISILYGLNIVNGDENGEFNPDDYLLRGDTMIMLYNYLAK